MATGFGFGTSSAPTFGATGGTGFGFGATQSVPATNTGFSFGLPTATTTSSGPAFSFGGFGAPAASTGFSFSNPTTSAQPFSFGGIAKTTPSFSFGGIGAQTSTTPSGFSFGQPNTFGTGGAFGTAATSVAPTFQANAAPVAANNLANLVAALKCPTVYGDERDAIIAAWNQLQAFWGSGQAYYSPNAPPVEITPENPLCRFKAIGYSCIPSAKPEDGLVSLIFNKKEAEIQTIQQQIIEHLHKCFGSKPNIAVSKDTLKAFPNDQTEMVIYLIEKSATGTMRRIPPAEVCAYLDQATVKPQLQMMGIMHVSAKAALSKDQIQLYLDSPPFGIDPTLWQQAIIDNPDPEKLIPVPLIGFDNLNRRVKCQDYETKQHQERLDIINDGIVELNRKRAITAAKIAENKRKLAELQHRVLKLLVQQEVGRKMGFSILEDEEQLRIKLEAIQAELNAPTQFKGHLKELISQIRMQNLQVLSGGHGERYTMEENTKEKIKEHLLLQQEGITHLISIIKEDLQDLKIIEDVSKETSDKQR